jgi:hypothetical protein
MNRTELVASTQTAWLPKDECPRTVREAAKFLGISP